MIIPKAFKVGRTRWVVERVWALFGPVCHGRTYFSTSTIKIAATNGHGKEYTSRQREEAFWHEALHTCFYDMGLPPHKHDEKLINDLAARLTQIVNSAEL